MREQVVRTEIYGFDLRLIGCELHLETLGNGITPPILLSEVEAEKLRLEMAKTQLWEWNQFAEDKRKTEKRNARYLWSWTLMTCAAIAAHTGYPSYWLAVLAAISSAIVWRWAKFREDRATRAAREERENFFPDWTYLRRRFDENPMVAVVGPFPPHGTG